MLLLVGSTKNVWLLIPNLSRFLDTHKCVGILYCLPEKDAI
jgi:hypothetical protein